MKRFYSIRLGIFFLFAVMQLALLPGLSYAQGCAMMLAKKDHAQAVMAQMPDDCHGAQNDQSDDDGFPAELLCDCCLDDLRLSSASVMPTDDDVAMDHLLSAHPPLMADNHPSIHLIDPGIKGFSADPPLLAGGRLIRIYQQSFLI